jgi:DNA (cytosine-5)-methyltransferase 1
VVGALSARGYTKYTDQEFVRGGQLVTDRDLREREVPVGVNPSNPDIAGTLPSNQQGGQRTTDIAGAYVYRKSRRAQSAEDAESWVDDGVANTLNQFDTGDTRTTHVVAGSPTVRRLSPMECERLMGWPDGWTDIPWNKKDHAPDSRRYAACGNGVVAPVAYWIAARLAEVLK